MNTIEQKEIESSRHVRVLAAVHATNYSNSQDVEAATLALLWCAFEQEAMAQELTLLLDSARQAIAQSKRVPDGYALVPIEPTREMLNAGRLTIKGAVDFSESEQARCAYINMLAAAPQVAQPQASEPVNQATYIHVFNNGYKSGHHDTVEGTYIDIHPSDMDSYHAEDVAELLQAQVAQTTPAQPVNQVLLDALEQCAESLAFARDRLGMTNWQNR